MFYFALPVLVFVIALLHSPVPYHSLIPCAFNSASLSVPLFLSSHQFCVSLVFPEFAACILVLSLSVLCLFFFFAAREFLRLSPNFLVFCYTFMHSVVFSVGFYFDTHTKSKI